jgi:hypothetical protein
MSDVPAADGADDRPGDGPELTSEERAARARRLAEVFGDVLPEQTSDDRDPGEPPGDGDAWLRAQVPPHHG